MEYDPTISTHKASSIASTISSSSTWDHPISASSQILCYPEKQPLDQDELVPNFAVVDYHFNDVANRISTTDDDNNYHATEKSTRNDSTFFDTFIRLTPTGTTNTITTRKENQGIDDFSHNNYNHYQLSNVMNYHQQPSTYPVPIYLQHGDQITVPSISIGNHHQPQNRKIDSTFISKDNNDHVRQIRSSPPMTSEGRQRSNSDSSTTTSNNKRPKSNHGDVLLTTDEKRVNHIVSEKKRRHTIQLGFKDLEDVIPTLKYVNNSKSSTLFKAAEYIKYLDKLNSNLREKVFSLQVRISAKNMEQQQGYKVFGKQPEAQNNHLLGHTVVSAHKDQQRQLEELQEQVRAQQLIANSSSSRNHHY